LYCNKKGIEMKNEIKLAGHTFTLKHIQYGIHSEETVDYMADLYCDGKLIAYVENDGHGGCSTAHWNHDNLDFAREVELAVRKEVWITCQDGTQIYYTLGEVADEVLELTERNKEIKRLQKNALVLERDGDIFFSTHELPRPVTEMVKTLPASLKKIVEKAKSLGWTVVNTNIPEEMLR
jgi:hypothetical protein